MKSSGLGSVLNELKNQVQKIRREIKEIDKSFAPIPEVIESTNVVRENEYLSKVNNKKTELIEAYEHYTKQIENLLISAFEIQTDLKDILKAQSELISSKKHVRKRSIKEKSKRKNPKRRKK